MRRLEDTRARCPPKPSGEVEGERLALEVPPAAEGLTSGWRGGGGAGKGLRGFEGSRVSRARWGRRRGEVVWAARQARVSGGGRGCLAEERPSIQAPLGTWDSRPQPPLPSDLGVRNPAPSLRIPESRTLSLLYPRTRESLGLRPLLPSDLEVHTPTPTLNKMTKSGPLALPPPNPGVPTSSFSPSWIPALRGLRGRSQLVAMVPDCLGLLSDPWGLPRVCREGEGDPDLREVQRQPLPQIGPMGPESSCLHQRRVR